LISVLTIVSTFDRFVKNMEKEEIILKDKRTIQRIGNSRGITLPKAILNFLNSPIVEIKLVRRGLKTEVIIERVKREEEH